VTSTVNGRPDSSWSASTSTNRGDGSGQSQQIDLARHVCAVGAAVGPLKLGLSTGQSLVDVLVGGLRRRAPVGLHWWADLDRTDPQQLCSGHSK
jgi:hypothetical protein